MNNSKCAVHFCIAKQYIVCLQFSLIMTQDETDVKNKPLNLVAYVMRHVARLLVRTIKYFKTDTAYIENT